MVRAFVKVFLMVAIVWQLLGSDYIKASSGINEKKSTQSEE